MKFESLKELVEHLINRQYFDVDDETVYDTIRKSLRVKENNVGWRYINGEKNNTGDVKLVGEDLNALREDISNEFDAFIHKARKQGYVGNDRLEAINNLDNPIVAVQAFGDNTDEYGFLTFDNSIGIPNSEFEEAVGKNQVEAGIDKRQDPLLLGEFGQGSFASIGISSEGCKLIVSIHENTPNLVSFTITRQNENGDFQYMTINGEIPSFTLEDTEGLDLGDTINHTLTTGTLTKVFKVNRTKNRNSIRGDSFKRKFGYKYPDPAVPLRLYDSRSQYSDNDYDEWNGLLSEVADLNKSKTFKKTMKDDTFGEIDFIAVVPEEGEEFSKEYISAGDPRTFFTIHGMTHETESEDITASKFGLDRIHTQCLLFIECSKMNVPVSDVFKVDRTGMKESGQERDEFYDTVKKGVQNWTKLQDLNDSRPITPNQLSQSPIKSLELLDTDITSSEESTIKYNINLEENVDTTYLDEAELEVDISTDRGGAEITDYAVKETTLEVTVDPTYTNSQMVIGSISLCDTSMDQEFTERMLIENDTNFNTSTGTNSVPDEVTACIESEDVNDDVKDIMTTAFQKGEQQGRKVAKKNAGSENQADRSKTGGEFEEKIHSRLDKHKFENVTLTMKKSNLPESVKESLYIKYPDGSTVYPDADIVVHNSKKPLAVISCKKSIRERLTQTQAWEMHYKEELNTIKTTIDNLKFFFVTADPDGELEKGRKPRKIASTLSGTFVVNSEFEEYNSHIRPFEDLKNVLSTLERNRNPTKSI